MRKPCQHFPILAAFFALLLVHLPTSSMRALPTLSPAVTCVVLPSVPASSIVNPSYRKSGTSRQSRFRDHFRALREWRRAVRKSAEEGEAGKLSKQSLTFGIISLSAIMLGWVPVVGGVLALAAVPMAVLAVVKGFKAKKMGSEKNTGVILGFITLGIFVIAMLAALLVLVGLILLWGQ